MNKEHRPDDTRQGQRDVPVLVVLILGLVLAAVGWWGVEMYGLMLDEQQPVETTHSRDVPARDRAGE